MADDDTVSRVGERMDFACQAAPGASDGLVLALFSRPGAVLMSADDRGVAHQVLSVRVAGRAIQNDRKRRSCTIGWSQGPKCAGRGAIAPLYAKWLRQTKSGGPTDRPKPKRHASGMLTVEVPAAKAAHVAATEAAATKAAHVAATEAAHVAATEAAEVVATEAVRVAEVSSG